MRDTGFYAVLGCATVACGPNVVDVDVDVVGCTASNSMWFGWGAMTSDPNIY